MITTIDEFAQRFPRELAPEELRRAELLLGDAEELIDAEFTRDGRDLGLELEQLWLKVAARRVVVEMVSAAILVGDSAGRRQYAVTVGGVTESTTWADVNAAPWGALVLSDVHRRMLGLPVAVTPRATCPPKKCWPERW